ncbi:hypothetical protein EV356DRAFT_499560 [Viridothelium virens]|uniref:Uncharacterized protein n=1 Tax=Viridothelium virens TaxID=1048519 RepID=A0A6A6HN27_VIRVR|nr:hypothetical protein EV356DRAFT_499560 [Viridothelium virens]
MDVHPKTHHSGKLRASLWLLKYLFQAALAIVAFAITWKLAAPSPTNLHSEILTADGKSFPLGQLTWSQNFTPLPCGKTPTEALARGCHFDIIATAWLPPKCIDYELAAEFEALHPWQYFPNANGSDPFLNDSDTLGMQTGLIWTTHRWHAAHCVYMWKKLNRALIGGWNTDAETVQQAHTNHCTVAVLDVEEVDAIRSIMEIIYPPC